MGKSVYSLLTWCDGEDAEAILPRLTETEQYLLGIKSGEILRKRKNGAATSTVRQAIKSKNTRLAALNLTETI